MRSIVLTAGLAVLLAGGVVHGVWTERWKATPYVEEAAARLAALPDDIGAWKGVETPLAEEDLALTGAVGHYNRTFTDPVTGEKVLVTILCGRPAQMVVHRPEHCYRAAGFEQAGSTVKLEIKPAAGPPAKFLSGVFGREDAAGPTQMRIFWSWLGKEGWSAPDNPRFAFARERALYKLYVIRNTTGTNVSVTDDPAARLIAELLPELRRALIDS